MNIHFIGDIMLGRRIQGAISHHKKQSLIAGIKSVIPANEFIIGNLEAPFATTGDINKDKDSHLTFKIDPKYVTFLNEIGIDAVTLANNHMTDYGMAGILSTQNTLTEANIQYAGAGKNKDEAIEPFYIHDDKDKYAILAFNAFVPFSLKASKSNFGVARFDRGTIKKAIAKCDKNISGIILTVHWGIDYHPYPIPALINLAKETLDLYPQIITIVGHHPHLQQPVVFHGNKPIFCSLGNFLFDEPFPLSRIGSILTLSLKQGLMLGYKTQYTQLNADFDFSLLKEPILAEEKSRLSAIEHGITNNIEAYMLEDKKWIKYLLYQAIRYASWNDFSYLMQLYSVTNIFKKLIRQ